MRVCVSVSVSVCVLLCVTSLASFCPGGVGWELVGDGLLGGVSWELGGDGVFGWN